MKFRTELKSPPSAYKISHGQAILLLGSCFSNNIGSKLNTSKMDVCINPFGTVYNPISLAKLMQYTIQGINLNDSDLYLSQGVFAHPDFHSSFSAPTPQKTIQNIQEALSATKNYLEKVDHVFLTLGTTMSYRMKATQNIVSNCHKMSSHLFDKVNLPIEDGCAALEDSVRTLIMLRPEISITFTVSPVRHIKDGIIENSRSKARLIEMAHKMAEQYHQIQYFPAYEWVIDDLRDYRFYESDLIHPNDMAVEYIWDKFSEHYFDSTTIKLNKQIDKISQSAIHKPFNPHTDEHQQFISHTLRDIHDLRSQYPYIDFEKETQELKKHQKPE